MDFCGKKTLNTLVLCGMLYTMLHSLYQPLWLYNDVYMYILYMYTILYMYIHNIIYVYTTYIYIYMYICKCLSWYVLNICIHIYIYIYVCKYVHVCNHLHMFMLWSRCSYPSHPISRSIFFSRSQWPAPRSTPSSRHPLAPPSNHQISGWWRTYEDPMLVYLSLSVVFFLVGYKWLATRLNNNNDEEDDDNNNQ